MASISSQAIRARIKIGNNIDEKTPNVVSFNVRKARGQMSATFTASLKIPQSKFSISSLGSLKNASVIIEAGPKGALKTIFTGRVYKATLNPIRTDASKVMLNVSGKDVLSVMEGQKVNRRVRAYRDGSKPPERWGMVTALKKDNSPTRATIPAKVYDKKPQGIVNMDFPDIIQVLAAYNALPDRAEAAIRSAITGNIIDDEEETT